MEAKTKSKPKTTKQKAKLQQIMQISFEKLTKKTESQQESQINANLEEEIQETQFNKIPEDEYEKQLDAYYQEQNKRFSFSQPMAEFQVQVHQQQQFQQQIIKQQEKITQSPSNRQQQNLAQSQQVYKNQQYLNVSETHMTNITQQSPVFIPQLPINSVNQQQIPDRSPKNNSYNQEDFFQINSQLNDSQDIPQLKKMSIKSEHVKKQSGKAQPPNNTISNILDNFLSNRQKINDQSGLNQSELFESPQLQNFGGGQNEQSVIQQQSLLQSIHNETIEIVKEQMQEYRFEDIYQNARKDSSQKQSIVNDKDDDDLDNLLQDLYECTTKQLPKQIIESNSKIVNQQAKEVMSTVFENQGQPQNQQANGKISYLTGSKIISEQKNENQSPIKKNNLQQEVGRFSSQDQKKVSVEEYFTNKQNQTQEEQNLIKGNNNNKQAIQQQFKNTIKVNEAEQQSSQQTNANGNQTIKPFQISSTDRNFKAKQSFGYELSFRSLQKNVLSITQYLFKYSKLIQEPNITRLKEIKTEKVFEYYKNHKIQCENFDYAEFTKLLKEKDPDFFHLCETNYILFQQGEVQDNATCWAQSYLLLIDLRDYLFSLGFVVEDSDSDIISQMVQEYQEQNSKDDQNLDLEAAIYAVYLAFQKVYIDLDGIMAVVKFFSDQDSNLIDVQTAKIVLSKQLHQQDIDNVFKWTDAQINYEQLFKVLTLLPY